MKIKEDVFTVTVIPNSSKNEIVGFDSKNKAYKIKIKAPAKDNKANKELLDGSCKRRRHKLLLSTPMDDGRS